MEIKADILNGRIVVHFPYSAQAVKSAKRVPGYSFVPKEKGGPHWSFPLNLKTARLLRENFGLGMILSPDLKAWGRAIRHEERQLRSMSFADTAKSLRIDNTHPELARWLRPYQRADIAFMAATSCINANQPGLGKTAEVIGAVLEKGLVQGRHLVIAPLTSLEAVWLPEITRWMDCPVHLRETSAPEVGWLLVNPEMIRWTKEGPKHPGLFAVEWDTITIDEFHKMGLSNPKTQGSTGARKLKAKARWALSGTPGAARPIKLWGALNFLDPKGFGSRWQWAKQWLRVTNNGFGHDIGEIQPGRETQFYEAHAMHIIRRTKAEVLPQLPPKQYKTVIVKIKGAHHKMYDKFAADCEIKIDGERLVATNVLAEYTRLKQMACARCEIRGGRLLPTSDSAKLDALLAQLDHHGLFDIDGESAVVGSQFKGFINVVAGKLVEAGLSVGLITGDTKAEDRATLVRDFQAGKIRVMCMTTMAGGVSITLDRADSVHILDETWEPDDQEQLEDRAHRASRMHNVMIYNYLVKDTIEEYISNIAEGKRITAKNIIDIRRIMLKTLEKN